MRRMRPITTGLNSFNCRCPLPTMIDKGSRKQKSQDRTIRKRTFFKALKAKWQGLSDLTTSGGTW
mgnify:CR=1 FL=1